MLTMGRAKSATANGQHPDFDVNMGFALVKAAQVIDQA
jgi:hypothetical protein